MPGFASHSCWPQGNKAAAAVPAEAKRIELCDAVEAAKRPGIRVKGQHTAAIGAVLGLTVHARSVHRDPKDAVASSRILTDDAIMIALC
jgi:hypothetical protein